MWNGDAVSVRPLLLAIAIASIGGCDSGAAPLREAKTAQDEPQIRLPDGRYRIGPDRSRAWLLTHGGVSVHDLSQPARTPLALPDWVSVATSQGCLPDLAFGPKGEAVITSNVTPTLWRIDPDTLAVTEHPLVLDADADKDIGFSGLAYWPQQGVFLAVSYAHGSLWRIDPLLKAAQKIQLSVPIRGACGLTVRSRSPQPAPGQPTDLCVHTPHGGWSVAFAPDGRSAFVSAALCAGGPWPPDTVRLKGK